MNHDVDLALEFGSHLADGVRAADFRRLRIDPYITLCSKVVLDFSGVRSSNSSFMNGLIAGVVEQHGIKALQVLVFKGCNANIKVLIEGAVALGFQKSNGRIGA